MGTLASVYQRTGRVKVARLGKRLPTSWAKKTCAAAKSGVAAWHQHESRKETQPGGKAAQRMKQQVVRCRSVPERGEE